MLRKCLSVAVGGGGQNYKNCASKLYSQEYRDIITAALLTTNIKPRVGENIRLKYGGKYQTKIRGKISD